MEKKVFLISVVSGVIASIAFSWMLEPFAQWLWNHAAISASSTLASIKNGAIQNAALGKRDWLLVALSIVFSLILTSLTISVFVFFYLKSRNGARLKDIILSAKKTKARAILTSTILILYLTTTIIYPWATTLFSAYVDIQMNASFSQRLDALGPYISEMEEKKLKSAWALMENQEDYAKINQQIDLLGKRAEIKIPEPLYR